MISGRLFLSIFYNVQVSFLAFLWDVEYNFYKTIPKRRKPMKALINVLLSLVGIVAVFYLVVLITAWI